MTRVLTLADVIAQLNAEAAESIGLNSTEVLDAFVADFENILGAVATYNFDTFLPYDLAIIQDACPVGYWRLNENGNILTVADQSMESGVGTWVAANATQTSSTTQAKDGTHSNQLSSTAAGSVTATAAGAGAKGYPVIPGVDYVFSYWVFNTSTAKNFDAQIVWLNAAGSVISTSSGSTTSATQNTWVQIFGLYAAPATAVAAKVQVQATAAGAAEIYYYDLAKFFQVGYDSNSLGLSQGFRKNPATGAAGAILPAQSGPYSYPDASFLPGSALFNTTTASLTIPSSTQLAIVGDVTMEAWISPTIALGGTTQYGVVAKGGNAGEYSMSIKGDGSVLYSDSVLGTVTVANAGSLATTNQWSHIVVTRQFSTRTVTGYVNGVKKNAVAFVTAPVATSNVVAIGANASVGTVAGLKISEVAVYQRALTAAQVQNHFLWGGANGGTVPTNQENTGSGWGMVFSDTGDTGKYGQYGFMQYVLAASPSTSVYDGGAVWDTFVWQYTSAPVSQWGGGVWGGISWS